MSRNASAEFLAQTAASQSTPFYLFEGYWPSGAVYLTSTAQDVTRGGITYMAGLGSFLSFDAIEESVDMEATGAEITLSGVPREMISLLDTQDFINRPARILKGYFREDGSVIPPVVLFEGLMDSVEFSENPTQGTAEIRLPVLSHWVDFERTNGRYTNDEQQKQFFPLDKGFEFVAGLANKEILW